MMKRMMKRMSAGAPRRTGRAASAEHSRESSQQFREGTFPESHSSSFRVSDVGFPLPDLRDGERQVNAKGEEAKTVCLLEAECESIAIDDTGLRATRFSLPRPRLRRLTLQADRDCPFLRAMLGCKQ
jgi:hypothetical protein